MHRSDHHTTTEEPFVPVDPFLQPSFLVWNNQNDVELGILRKMYIFMSDTLPRLIYLSLLFWLPAVYFSRIATIFRDAEVSRADIQRMIDAGGGTSESRNSSTLDSNEASNTTIYVSGTRSPVTAVGIVSTVASVRHISPPLVSPALMRFKRSWEACIDSLLRDWKALSFISAVLIPVIFAIFQILSAQEDPVIKTAASLSLVCAIISLIYGCTYIVGFEVMRGMYRASKWAKEARKTDALIWWNVWVLLAMPLVWMAWSMVFFIFTILFFLWRTGPVLDPNHHPSLSTRAALGPRIAIMGVFGMGMIYFVMIVRTLRSYGILAAEMGVHAPAGGATYEQRARDVEIAMDRQGREQERGVSGQRHER